jgi:hypothetical protein
MNTVPAWRQPEAEQERGHEAEPAGPCREAGQQLVDPRHGERVEKAAQAEPQRHQGQKRQAERFQENLPEFGGEQLRRRRARRVKDHGLLRRARRR